MNIVIIPGFTGYPEEKTFIDLEADLVGKGHQVIKIAWPNFPNNLKDYNFTSTIEHIETILKEFDMKETITLDSTGIGLLVAASNSLRAVQGGIRLVSVKNDIFKLLRSMRLVERLRVSPEEEQVNHG